MDELFKYLVSKKQFSVPVQYECTHDPLTIMRCCMKSTFTWYEFQIEQLSKSSYRLLVFYPNNNKYTVYECSSVFDIETVLDWYLCLHD